MHRLAHKLRLHDVGGTETNEAELGRLALLLAFRYGFVETFPRFARKQIGKRIAVALGRRRHDHLVSDLRAIQEACRVKTRMNSSDFRDLIARLLFNVGCACSVIDIARPDTYNTGRAV